MKDPRDEIHVDTRASPTGPFGDVAVHGMFATWENTAATSEEWRTEVSNIVTLGSASTTDALPLSQTMLSPTESEQGSLTSLSQAAPRDHLNGGAIFAIVIGSIVGIACPIVLVVQYIKLRKRAKEEDEILNKVLATGVVDKRALAMGLERLQGASERKWSGDKLKPRSFVEELERWRERDEAKEERLLLQSLFKPECGSYMF